MKNEIKYCVKFLNSEKYSERSAKRMIGYYIATLLLLYLCEM